MDGGKCILQVRGVRPFLSEKFDITAHKNYKYLSDANPKNAFKIEKFVSTKLKVKPDDEYDYMDFTPPDEEMPTEALNDFANADDITEDTDNAEDFSDDLEPI